MKYLVFFFSIFFSICAASAATLTKLQGTSTLIILAANESYAGAKDINRIDLTIRRPDGATFKSYSIYPTAAQKSYFARNENFSPTMRGDWTVEAIVYSDVGESSPKQSAVVNITLERQWQQFVVQILPRPGYESWLTASGKTTLGGKWVLKTTPGDGFKSDEIIVGTELTRANPVNEATQVALAKGHAYVSVTVNWQNEGQTAKQSVYEAAYTGGTVVNGLLTNGTLRVPYQWRN